MAPKQAAKRRASVGAAAGEPDVKRRATDFVKQQGITKVVHQAMVSVLRHRLSGLPEDVCEMLLAALPWSLCVPASRRREDQAAVVGMIGGVVEVVRTGLQDAVEVEEAKVAELAGKSSGLEDGIRDAEATHAQAQRGVGDCRSKLQAASEALAKSKSAFKAAEEEDRKQSLELQKASSWRGELDEMLSGSLRTLLDGAWQDGEEKPLIAIVCAAADKYSLEASMRAALPASLGKRERGPFDKTLLTTVETEFRSKLDSATEAVQAAQARVDAMKAKVEEAKAAVELASPEPPRAARQLCGAEDVASKAAAAVKAAKASAAGANPELNEAKAARDEKQRELVEFKDSISTFDRLRDRTEAAAQHGAEGGGAAAAA